LILYRNWNAAVVYTNSTPTLEFNPMIVFKFASVIGSLNHRCNVGHCTLFLILDMPTIVGGQVDILLAYNSEAPDSIPVVVTDL
jgi:hypothetical protein